MSDTYTIYLDGKTFANEKDESLAKGIYKILTETYPRSEVKLMKWRPIQGGLLLKIRQPNLNIPMLSCIRCGHTWPPRKAKMPDVCPKCKSKYWNRQRTLVYKNK